MESDLMWNQWYMLARDVRDQLVSVYGSEANAAYELFGSN